MNKFVKNVTDVASGLMTGIFNGDEPKGVDLVNTISLSLKDIESVRVKYIAESITLSDSKDGNLIIKEYMNKNEEETFAEITQKNTSIEIKHGRRKGFKLRSRIEVYIPKEWIGKFTLSTIYGSIRTKCDWTFKTFNAESMGGDIQLGTIDAEKIKLSSANGDITALSCFGNIDFRNGSGAIRVDNVIGEGSFYTNSGSITLNFQKISAHVDCGSQNGDVYIHLAENIAVELDAVTQSGSIYTSFDKIVVMPKENGKQSNAHGFLGKSPYKDIQIKTVMGDVHISD
jgi:DUF4097 and DUF4098 domain-containing protein YvlB